MPRASKSGAATPPPEDPFKDAPPPMDLTPEAAKAESPGEQVADAVEPVTTERTAEEQATIEAAHAMEDPSGGAMEGAELPPVKAPAKRAPRKAAAPRTRPVAVEGTPDASLPGGEAKRATLEFGSLADEEDFLNILWYGPEGVGKTTAALRAADHGRVLVVTAEGGLKRRALAKAGINVENVVLWPQPGHEDELTRDGIEALGKRVRSDLQADPAAWYAVIWDSGSAVADRLLRQVVAAEVAKDASLPEHKRKPSRADVFFTDISDYGTMTAQMAPLIHQYRDLQCHFLVTALERRDVDEDTGQVMYGPVFTPAVSAEARASADVVVRVSQEENDGETVVVGLTRPSPRYRGKDRFDATPHRMADPSFTRILGYVETDLIEGNDPVQGTLPAATTRKSGKITKEN